MAVITRTLIVPLLNRRSLITGTAFAMAALAGIRHAGAEKPTKRSAESFTFVFMTDSHIQPELDAGAGCAACFRQISKEPADFVIHGGDHVFDALEVDQERAFMLRDLYCDTEKELAKKVYHTIGNHDCFGLFPISGVDPGAPGYGKAFYTERFGAPYYSFDHKGVHFVVLDSIGFTADRSYEGSLDPDQIAWLRGDLLALPPGTRIIVTTHIPLVTGLSCYEPLSWTKTPHNWTNVVNAREILALLRPYHVVAVLQGHSHVAETLSLNGIPFITGGAVSGNWWEGRWLGTSEGYMLVTVDGDRVSAQYESFGFQSVRRNDVEISPD
jgi:3',5'-cyclic AMP phosphodiesterase CpdA